MSTCSDVHVVLIDLCMLASTVGVCQQQLFGVVIGVRCDWSTFTCASLLSLESIVVCSFLGTHA